MKMFTATELTVIKLALREYQQHRDIDTPLIYEIVNNLIERISKTLNSPKFYEED